MNKFISKIKAYSTHMPMLIKAIQSSGGSVLELGAGVSSTPIIHWLCQKDERCIFTYESDPDFLVFAQKFQSKNHHVRFIEDWKELNIKGRWSVVLIDHSGDRAESALYLKDKVDYIILHDSEAEGHYGYDKIWKDFKYRYDWKSCRPWTTVVSNFKDLSIWN